MRTRRCRGAPSRPGPAAPRLSTARTPCSGGGVDLHALPGEHPQAHAAGRQVLHGVDQVGEGAAEAVELPDHEHVARPERAHAAVEPRPVVADAGREVVVDVDGVDARSASRCRSSDWEPAAFRDAGVADQQVSQTAVCDTTARAPSDEPRSVSYPVSDSMSCRRQARGPVPCAERALRSARPDGLGDRFTGQPFTPAAALASSRRRNRRPSNITMCSLKVESSSSDRPG